MEELYDLVSQGADFNFKDENGITPLMNISKQNDPTLIRLIAKNILKIDEKDKFGRSALYHATEANNIQGVEILISRGATIFDEIYMLAVHHNLKDIVNLFDMQDKDKRYMLKKYPSKNIRV